jgi:3-methyladenine DNA glycosylase AlkD
MTPGAVLAELKRLGSEQFRKTYRRHGVRGDLYGVSYAHLGKLVKRIGTDQKLAESLWASGNHDARILATMVADPGAMTGELLDSWVNDVENYVLADAVANLAARSAASDRRMKAWMGSSEEWICRIGWGILARRAMHGSVPTDRDLEKYLAVIEKRIHKSKNRVRDAMNMAVIAIGLRGGALQKRALDAAKRIGTVEVGRGARSTHHRGAQESEFSNRSRATPSLHESVPQRAVQQRSSISGSPGGRAAIPFGTPSPAHQIEDRYDIRTIQELLGHKDVKATMICTHVLILPGTLGARSPATRSGGPVLQVFRILGRALRSLTSCRLRFLLRASSSQVKLMATL